MPWRRRIEKKNSFRLFVPAEVIEVALLAILVFHIEIPEVLGLARENSATVRLHLAQKRLPALRKDGHIELKGLCKGAERREHIHPRYADECSPDLSRSG
jgi:hypothetical protein